MTRCNPRHADRCLAYSRPVAGDAATERFERDGYLVVRNAVPSDVVDACRVQIDAALRARGVGIGDTVSAMLANTPEMIEAHFGVPMAGAVLIIPTDIGGKSGQGSNVPSATPTALPGANGPPAAQHGTFAQPEQTHESDPVEARRIR